LRRLPGSDDVVLFFNNSKFNKQHHHFGERTPLTYMYAKPAWNRDQIHLRAALIPRRWFDANK
jgi:hypothetical protein